MFGSCIKEIALNVHTNGQSGKEFLLKSNFVSNGLSAYSHALNIQKLLNIP